MTRIGKGAAQPRRSGAGRGATTIRRGKRSAPPQRGVKRASLRQRILARIPVSATMVRRTVAAGALALTGFMVWTLAAVTGFSAWVGTEIAAAVGRAGFVIERVEVLGANRIDRLHVYDIVLRERNRSMAAVDLSEVREGLLAYGWVGDARVSRRLPDTLVVELVERAPVAVWQHRGRLSLIDDRGAVLENVGLEDAAGLPVIVGAGANRRIGELHALIAEAPALQPQLAGASWVGNRRWDLRFRSGEVLALPEGAEAANAAFANFARMDGVNRLLGRGIVRFDMRNPERMVMRPGREGAIDPSAIVDATPARSGPGG
jgi:cell division protein FtsQ